MTGQQLRQGRQRAGWTQERVATRLGLTQEYVSLMERGRRRIPPHVARAAARLLDLAPTTLPLPAGSQPRDTSEEWLERAVARLGYPGFAYRRRPGGKRNPAEVLLKALARDRLDPRLVESLPWLLLQFDGFDPERVANAAKLRNLQNRLGFIVAMARELAESRPKWQHRVAELRRIEELLEPARLVREEALGESVSTERMRGWLRRHRSPLAEHWNLLSDLRTEHLSYADEDRGTVAGLPG